MSWSLRLDTGQVLLLHTKKDWRCCDLEQRRGFGVEEKEGCRKGLCRKCSTGRLGGSYHGTFDGILLVTSAGNDTGLSCRIHGFDRQGNGGRFTRFQGGGPRHTLGCFESGDTMGMTRTDMSIGTQSQ
eukprot:scaffold3608_cov183-Amphora_coffeaeformis.AAC.32